MSSKDHTTDPVWALCCYTGFITHSDPIPNPAHEGSFISYTSLYRGVSVLNPCIYPIDLNTLYWQSSRQTFNKLDISWVEVKFSY